MGGLPPLGYDLKDRKLIVNPREAQLVCDLYRLYLELGCVSKLKTHLDREGIKSKVRISVAGNRSGGSSYSRGALYQILKNRLYLGEVVHRDQVYAGEHEAIVPRELWDRVQAQLRSDNQGRRNGIRATSPSLLAGLLQDSHGRRFTPSHAVKRGRRYRYYVCQSTRSGSDRTGRTARLPAGEIEALVLARLRSALESDHEIMDRLGLASDTPAFTQQLVTSARKWSGEWDSVVPTEIHKLVRSAIKRIIVQEQKVELYVSRSELRDALAEHRAPSSSQVPGDDLFILETEAKLKRCGGEIRLVVPPKSDGEMVGKSAPALLRAVARAHVWRERMVEGSLHNGRSIAGSSGLNQRSVRRVLQCAFLAPDIVEAILDGRQPHNLTVRKLWRDLPMHWAEQRRRLGFSRPGLS